MSCSKCKAVETKDDLLATCDKCNCKLCQSCAKLSTTEYRAATLKSARTLIYLCSNCRKTISLTQENKILNEIQTDIKKICNKLNEILNLNSQQRNATNTDINQIIEPLQNEMKVLRDQLQYDIKNTKQEVTNIKDSNIDMIKLLTTGKTQRTYSEATQNSSLLTLKKTSPLLEKQRIPATKVKLNSYQQSTKNDYLHPLSNSINNDEGVNGNKHTEDSDQQNSDSQNFMLVKRKPRKPKEIGTNAGVTYTKEEGFEARGSNRKSSKDNKKIWLFISRAKEHVTEEIVKKYIQEKSMSEVPDISVKLLKTHYKKKDNNCFLVGVDPCLKEMIYEHSFWPKGIAFERFNFRRGQHFLDNPHQTNIGVNDSSITMENSVFLSQ